jgi:hypothetical protein
VSFPCRAREEVKIHVIGKVMMSTPCQSKIELKNTTSTFCKGQKSTTVEHVL